LNKICVTASPLGEGASRWGSDWFQQ